ncbi:MAG: Zn-ribbon domain-containing OB-fold protein [Mycobacterium sp.]
MSEPPHRVLPPTEGPTAFFWTSGADGGLRFLRCSSCAYYIHPPTSYCPQCGGRDSAPTLTGGRGTVYSFTINHQPWDGTAAPYPIAVVELDEQRGLRLTTNLVGIATEDVRIGMPVEVIFEDHGDVYLPLFRPVTR